MSKQALIEALCWVDEIVSLGAISDLFCGPWRIGTAHDNPNGYVYAELLVRPWISIPPIFGGENLPAIKDALKTVAIKMIEEMPE